MRTFWSLTRVSVAMSLYNMNLVRRRTGGNSRRGFGSTLGLIVVILMVYSGFIARTMAQAFSPLGFTWLVLVIGLFFITMFIFATTLYSIGAVLFESRDTDQLFAYPLSHWQIVASKIVGLTVQSWLMGAIFGIPFFGVYAYYAHPGPIFFVAAIVALIVVPGVPMFVMGLIAFIVAVISGGGSTVSRYISMILTIAAIVGLVVGLNVGVRRIKVTTMDSSVLVADLQKYYPPAGYLTSAMWQGNGLHLLYGLVWNLLPFALLCALISVFYVRIRSRATTVGKVKALRPGQIRYGSASVFAAVLRKEFGRVLYSPMYLLNSCVGAVLLVVLSIVLPRVSNGANMQQLLTLLHDAGLGLAQVMLVLFFFLLSVGTTTAASISTEGHSLWIVKSFPVPTGMVLRTKLLVDWLIFAPAVLVAAILATAIAHLGGQGFVILLVAGVAYALVAGLVGLVYNLHYYQFDAINDQQATKNSASVMLTLGTMIVVTALVVFVFWLINHYGHIDFMAYWGIVVGALVVAGVALYRYVMTRGVALFEALS